MEMGSPAARNKIKPLAWQSKGNGQNYCTQTGPTILQKDRWSLHVPPSPTLKDGVLFV